MRVRSGGFQSQFIALIHKWHQDFDTLKLKSIFSPNWSSRGSGRDKPVESGRADGGLRVERAPSCRYFHPLPLRIAPTIFEFEDIISFISLALSERNSSVLCLVDESISPSNFYPRHKNDTWRGKMRFGVKILQRVPKNMDSKHSFLPR